LAAALLATIALFTIAARLSTGAAVPWTRRPVFALVGSGLLARPDGQLRS
jgi:hypothetical protein